METEKKKVGVVCIVGRPNSGKSTLLNAILKQKVSITSPKPQTTRFPIQAVYEDDRGQIIFVDTPGVFGKVHDNLSKHINETTHDALSRDVDVVVYLVDHTRTRDFEENKVFGIVRKATVPKLLVFNKTDVRTPTHRIQYKFMEEEFDATLEVSALARKNLNILLETIFSFLPEGEAIVDTKTITQPGLNLDSKTFLSEIIREKAFLNLRKEIPYSLMTTVDEFIERPNGNLYVKARIITNNDRYKSMIIGKGGYMIKEISMAARKELETATNKKVFLDLTVDVDTHWVEYL